MKKTWKRLTSLLIACMMICIPASRTLAASFDASWLEPAVVLFPGDSLINIGTAVTLDGEQVVLSEADPTTWTNETEDKAYRAATAEDGSLQLALAGYVLVVEKGTSSVKEENVGAHRELTEENMNEDQDVACYPAYTQVTLKADEPEEGMEFAGWNVTANAETNENDVVLADAMSMETTVTMPERKLTVTATYQAVQQTEQAPLPEENGGEVVPEGDPGYVEGVGTDGTDMSFEGDPGYVEDNGADGADMDPEGDPGYVEGVGTDGTDMSFEGDPGYAEENEADGADMDLEGDPGYVEENGADGADMDLEGDPGYVEENGADGTDMGPEGDPDVQNYDGNITPENGIQDISAGIDTGIMDLGDGSAIVITTSDEYGTSPQSEAAPYALTVDGGVIRQDGSTAASFAENTQVELQAGEPASGMYFSGWSAVNAADGTPMDSALFGAQADMITTFVMPACDTVVTANYLPLAYYVNVTGGTFQDGSTEGSYAAGVQLELHAGTPEDGKEFAGWTVTYANGEPVTAEYPFADAGSMVTAFTMPAGDVTVTAQYGDVPHTLTVEDGLLADGSTSGTYMAGEQIELHADSPADGMEFAGWSVMAESGETVSQDLFSSAASEDTIFTMPENNVTVIAAYADVPYTVTVENGRLEDGQTSGAFTAGTQLTLVAENTLDGRPFSKWTARFTDSGALIADTEFANAASTVTAFTMPGGNVTVTAEYAATYTVEVNSGVITGGAALSYTAGAQITLQANDAQPGMQFSRWSAVEKETGALIADSVFGSVMSAATTFTVPASNVVLTAEYVPQQYKVTVANGLINNTSTEMLVPGGTVVTITANANPAGQVFSRWSVNNDTYDLGENTGNSTINIEIRGDMNFAAIYEGALYHIVINDGTANYEEAVSGTEITITAGDAPEGMEFDYWKVDTQNVSLKSSDKEITTFTMPMADVEISAYYRMKEYHVTVQNGYTDNDFYYMGQEVTVYSNYPASGREFDRWTAVKGSVSFADASRWKTTFTMPAGDVTVGAVYRDGPSPNDNQVLDLVAGGEYITNTTIKFTAAGAGMGNSNPNPGDYRYRPSGYQIGNVTGSWQASPYTTSMSIKATGEYTLKVSYAKDVYDGNNWVPDGTSDTRSVTFRIITPSAAVATGDATPVAGMAMLAGFSLLIFLLLLTRKRRHA